MMVMTMLLIMMMMMIVCDEEQVRAGGSAVLSCPAYFGEEQREAMAVAGEKAGIVVLDTIDEPVVRTW